jgi:hypothetical protein
VVLRRGVVAALILVLSPAAGSRAGAAVVAEVWSSRSPEFAANMGANLDAIAGFLPAPGSPEPLNVPGIMAAMNAALLAPQAGPAKAYAGLTLMRGLSRPELLLDVSRSVESEGDRRRMVRWASFMMAHEDSCKPISEALPSLQRMLVRNGKLDAEAGAAIASMFDGSRAGSGDSAVEVSAPDRAAGQERAFARLRPYRAAPASETRRERDVPSPPPTASRRATAPPIDGVSRASGKVVLKNDGMVASAEWTITQRLKASLNAAGFETNSGTRSNGSTLRVGDTLEIRTESRRLSPITQADGARLERWAVEVSAVAPDGRKGESGRFVALRPARGEGEAQLPVSSPEALLDRAIAFGSGESSLPGLRSIDPDKVRRILYVSAGPDIMTVSRYAARFPNVDEIQFEDIDFERWKNLPALLSIFGIKMTDAQFRRLLDQGEATVPAFVAGRPVTLRFRRQDALKQSSEPAPFDLVMVKKPGDYGSLSYVSGFWPRVLSRVRKGGFVTTQVSSEPTETAGREVDRMYPRPAAILEEIKTDRIDDVAVYRVY